MHALALKRSGELQMGRKCIAVAVGDSIGLDCLSYIYCRLWDTDDSVDTGMCE